MAATHKEKILLLTLVHPDFLPPVYATAQVLRDEGYAIHILTFDSFVPANLDIGAGITIESAGKHHGIGLKQRLQLRNKYTRRAQQLANEQPKAIIAFCAFSYLCALKIRMSIPVMYNALEVADFIPSLFRTSPLSHINNLRALNNIHKADLVATPSVQRSAWLAGRSHLDFLPHTILNTAYLPKTEEADTYDIFKNIIAPVSAGKKIVLYTGAVNAHLCIMELAQAFELVNDEQSALVITGIKDNAYCNELKAYVAGCRSKNRIVLLPYVTRAEMLALQANAAIGVCLAREYANNVESRMMAPNKVGEYLQKGLYLLGVQNEYMRPFGMKGIASLATAPAPAAIGSALQEALDAVNDKTYKARIRTFVNDFFCMQQQLRPILDFLKKQDN